MNYKFSKNYLKALFHTCNVYNRDLDKVIYWWGGFNLEYGNLKNGKLENVFVSKNGKTASPKDCNSKLKFNLENGYLENGVGNKVLFTL